MTTKKAKTTAFTQRSARRLSVKDVGETVRIGGSGGLSPQIRSKLTERRTLTTRPIATATYRTRSQAQSTSAKAKSIAEVTSSHVGKKMAMRGIPNNTAARAIARQMQRQEATTTAAATKLNAVAAKPNAVPAKSAEHLDNIQFAEIGIQTNEPEILNHELIVGDIKLLPVTRSIAAEIERQRNEALKKQMLKAQRKFEAHAEREEEHLTDLQEFLQKSAISRRMRKPKLSLELDKKLINSMDKILNKSVPKTESITDIKGRIKKKEQELLTLFNAVENLKV